MAISCILFGGVLINQSCTQDTIKPLKISEDKLAFSESKQDLAFSEFESLLNSVSPKIQNIVDKHQYIISDIDTEENNAIYELEAKELLMPLVVGAKKLLSTFDISEEDLQKEFSDPNDTRIALVGLVMFALQDNLNKQNGLNPSINISGVANREIENETIGEQTLRCLGVAIGLDAVISAGSLIGSKSNRWGMKALVKVVGKVASRFLGPVGVIIAVGSFTACMAGF